MLEFDGNCQNGLLGELNGLSTSLIRSSFNSTVAESDNTDQLSLLDQLPSFLQAKYSTDIGRIHSAPPIQIQIDPSNPFPSSNQYLISKEALQHIKPVIENYINQGLIIPFTNACDNPLIPVRKPKR